MPIYLVDLKSEYQPRKVQADGVKQDGDSYVLFNRRPSPPNVIGAIHDEVAVFPKRNVNQIIDAAQAEDLLAEND